MWAVACGLNASAFLNFLHFFQAVLQDGVLSLELKITTKQLSLKHQGKPVAVIRPHAMEGHLVQLKPLGPHFLTFCWLSMEVICTENVNVHEFRVAHKFKCDLTHLLQGVHSQATLLQELPAQEKGFLYESELWEDKNAAISFTHNM